MNPARQQLFPFALSTMRAAAVWQCQSAKDNATIARCRRRRRGLAIFLQLLATLAAAIVLSLLHHDASAAVAYAAAGNAATGTTTLSVPYPANTAARNLLVLVVGNKYPANGPATPAGWTLVGQSSGGLGAAGADSGQVYASIFVKEALGTESGNLAITLSGSNTATARMFRYTLASGAAWSYVATGGADNSAGTTWSVTGAANPGITVGDIVIVGSAINGNRVSNWSESTSAAGATFGSTSERNDSSSNTGDDMAFIVSEHPVTAGTATAAPVFTMTGASGSANTNSPTGASVILRIREVPATTLATGTDPGASTLAPGAAIADLDAFTLNTSSGTDSVTALTVTLTGANSYAALSEVRITSSNGTSTYFAAVANPGSNSISFSGGTPIPVSTTVTTFKLRITPKAHAAMPAPPGLAYAVGGTVTAFTSSNAQLGSDASSATLTVDNLSPGNVTAVSGSSSTGQATLSWTNPVDSDFSSVVVLRNTLAVSDAPVEGASYVAGNSIGSSTVACVVAAPTATCTDTGLSNGTAYYYKLFSKDSNGNYATGSALASALTPPYPAPTVTKSFNTSAIGVNGTSTLTITLTNPNNVSLSGLAFTDTYPSTNLKNAATPALTNTCGGTATAVAAASTLSLSAGVLPGNSSCSLSVSVTSASAANYINSTGAVSSSNASSGSAASATLAVRAVSASRSTVVANPTSVVADGVTAATITVTLLDASDLPVPGKSVTLLAGSGSSAISAASGVSSASGVVQFSVSDSVVEGPLTYTASDSSDAIAITQTAQVTFTTPPPVNCTSINGGGNWTVPATWTNCRGGVPLGGDSVTIVSGHAVNLNVTTPVLGDLSNGGTLSATATYTLKVGGNLSNDGTMSLAGASVDVYGNFSNNNGAGFNPGLSDSGTWTFSGSSVQSINSTGTLTVFPNLTLNNSLGIALNASVSIRTLLTLSNGYISTGSNIISTLANCPASIARSNGFVDGNVRLTFNSGTTACTFPVGSGSTYAPIGVGMTAGSAGGTLTGSTVGSDYPPPLSSTIDAAADANRYWKLGSSGDNVSPLSTYSLTFNFVAGDLDFGADPLNFVLGRYVAASAAWSLPAPVTPAATATSATGIALPAVSATDVFVVGQTASLCFSDNYNRTTGLGANWSVGTQYGGFTPAISNNRLRLTDTGASEASWATLNRTFPGAGNKIVIDFDHFAYNGSGADGIAVILSNAAVSPVVGAFGGSLGYAPKSNPGSDCTATGGCPGFTGGWIGVAIDEYGNFQNPTEGRYGGPGQVPDSLSIRGSGSGMSGYRYMTGTSTLTPQVDNNGSVATPYHYRITVDHSDTVHAYVTVERDVSAGGSSYTTLIPAFDAKNAAYSQDAVPANWQLSFTGSSGGATNIHEIDALRVCTTNAIVTPSLHHLRLLHGGTACTGSSDPAAVTVMACADANCSALYLGSVSVNLTAIAGATWTPTSVTFSGGQTTVALSKTTAGAVTLGAVASAPTTSIATRCFSGSTESCTLTFAACYLDAVEVGAAAYTPIYTKLVGTAFSLDVKNISGAAQTVSAVDIVDAGSGTPGNCSSYTSLAQTTTTGSPWSFTSVQTRSFGFTYANAVRNARIRITAGGGTSISCSSDNFAIRPLQLALSSSASQTASSGSPVFRAGNDTFTITASGGTGYDGTPKFNLSDSAMITGTSIAGTLGAATFSTTIAGTATASNLTYSEVGSINLAQYAVYDDGFAAVDSTKASPECTPDFSNTLTNNRYGCMFGSPVKTVGRFVPDHFTVLGSVANACSSSGFTYMGQAFTLSTTNVVEARNAANAVTANYSGAWATGTVSAGAENADNGSDLSARLTGFPTGSWSTGVYALSGSSATFSRPLSAPDGPYDSLDIGLTVNVNDASMTATWPTWQWLSAADMNPALAGGTTLTHQKFSGSPLRLRYGKLVVDNAYGSERQNLPVRVSAMYYAGSPVGWAINALDACTALPLAPFLPGIAVSPDKCYTAACTSATGGGSGSVWLHGVVGASIETLALPSAVSAATLAAGAGTLTLTAPRLAGMLELTLVAPTWLRSNSGKDGASGAACAGTGYDCNPTARVNLGVYGPATNKTKFIFLRESY